MPHGASGGTERTILVVEDNAADRTMIRRLLRNQRREYVIMEEVTGEGGLARCRASQPDCVLIDFYLPDMDAIEFLDRLRREAGPGMPVPVAILTGQEDDRLAVETLKRGAQDYLVKDALTAHGLVRAVENAIEKFQIRRELEEQRAAVELRNYKLEVLRDELQERMLELADATRTKDRFLAVMSHEMRTPLNAILGYAELLDMELDGALTDGQRHQVERIRVGSRHLLDLTNDVLDLTRADAQKLELDLRPIDLGAIIEEVVALLERQATAKGVALVAEPCATDLPRVQADLQRLRQVLTNLVANAIKFTDQGSIRIRCVYPDARDMIGLQVIDTGIGIAPEVLPLVFNEFYQADNELTRKYGGSGLGLAISQRLVRLMGGEITVDSAIDHGTTFTVLLRPAAAGSELRPEDVAQHDARMAKHAGDMAGHEMPGGTPGETPGAVHGTVVAFGEDPAALAELERRVRPNVRLVWTTNPDEVAERAVREHAALILLDVGSAGGLAWRAANMIQHVPELAATAVLLLPSIPAALPDEGSSALDLGWVALVPKPFTAEQLRQAVSTAARSMIAGRERAGTMGEAGDGAEQYRVLVVDDDPDSRRVAARFLADSSVQVHEAPNGEAALVDMRTWPPDVVVLDLMMPVLDGFGVLAAMRADPLLTAIPVVVLTAKTLTDAERDFLSRTAIRVLQKGAHRLADVASLVVRAAARSRGTVAAPPLSISAPAHS